MDRVRNFCDELETLLMGNPIFEQRMRGIGVIPQHVGLEYGLSGANIRASGVDWDLRRDEDSPLAWKSCDWKVWTHVDGDSFARYWVRLQETPRSGQDRRPVARQLAARADHGQGPSDHQSAGR